jgi:predicted small lipoprotein YifL
MPTLALFTRAALSAMIGAGDLLCRVILPEVGSRPGSVAVKGVYARHLNRLAVLMLVAFAAASCGRKGALEPPPNASVTPKTSAAAAAADAAQTNGGEVAASGTGQAPDAAAPSSGISSLRAKKPAPVRPPKTPFILDPLLE